MCIHKKTVFWTYPKSVFTGIISSLRFNFIHYLGQSMWGNPHILEKCQKMILMMTKIVSTKFSQAGIHTHAIQTSFHKNLSFDQNTPKKYKNIVSFIGNDF